MIALRLKTVELQKCGITEKLAAKILNSLHYTKYLKIPDLTGDKPFRTKIFMTAPYSNLSIEKKLTCLLYNRAVHANSLKVKRNIDF